MKLHLSPKGSVGGKARAQKDVSGVLNHAHDPARKEKRCRGDPPDALRPTDTYLPPRTTNAEREEFTNGLRGVDRERSHRCVSYREIGPGSTGSRRKRVWWVRLCTRVATVCDTN